MSATRYNSTATGNTSFGYFLGGSNGRTIVDRGDYSNDFLTASPKGPLSASPMLEEEQEINHLLMLVVVILDQNHQ